MELLWNASIEEQYQQQMQKEVIEANRVITLLGIILFPAFSVID